MTGTGTLTSLGNPSKSTILDYEEDKISIEFTASGAINKGQPVKLTNAGKVILWAKTDLQHLCLGIALSTQADGELISVVTRGYAIVYGISAGAANAGPATYNGYDTTNANTYDGVSKGFSIYGVATDATDAIAWIVDPAAAQYSLMRVLIKD